MEFVGEWTGNGWWRWEEQLSCDSWGTVTCDDLISKVFGMSVAGLFICCLASSAEMFLGASDVMRLVRLFYGGSNCRVIPTDVR